MCRSVTVRLVRKRRTHEYPFTNQRVYLGTRILYRDVIIPRYNRERSEMWPRVRRRLFHYPRVFSVQSNSNATITIRYIIYHADSRLRTLYPNTAESIDPAGCKNTPEWVSLWGFWTWRRRSKSVCTPYFIVILSRYYQ